MFLHQSIDISEFSRALQFLLSGLYSYRLDLSDQPFSSDIEVERLLRILGLVNRRNIPISIKSVDPTVKVKVPTPTTPDALFRYHLEICGPISRESILSLAQFAPNPTVKTSHSLEPR